MRELSFTQNLLESALQKASPRRIVGVHLSIGPFSNEREETIRYYWRDLAKGTPSEGAKLYFQHMPTEIRCLSCGGTFNLENDESICVYCRNDHLRWLGGDEVRLEGIDVE